MTRCEEIACDANNLYRAYKASIKGSKWKERTQRFEADYLRNIISIQDSLQNRTLQNDKTDEFQLSERGRIRSITSLTTKDRVIRHILCDDILLPEVTKKIIYDNGASIKKRGISHQRKRFCIHLRRYYQMYGNEGWILFGDFSKFYDNVVHEIAKQQLLKIFDGDEFLYWLLTVIFEGFKIDVSYMSDEEYSSCMDTLFDKNKYRSISKSLLNSEKWMEKSVNIGDQLSQIIGVFYPNRIDTYVKYVCGQRFYGRYMDDFYCMHRSKQALQEILKNIRKISKELGIHINEKKTRIVKISGSYKYLQIKYTLTKEGKIIKRINPKRVTSLRRKLKKLANKNKRGQVEYQNIENMFKGWMGNFYKLLSKQQRKNLLKLYEELFDKTITITNKKLVII